MFGLSPSERVLSGGGNPRLTIQLRLQKKNFRFDGGDRRLGLSSALPYRPPGSEDEDEDEHEHEHEHEAEHEHGDPRSHKALPSASACRLESECERF